MRLQCRLNALLYAIGVIPAILMFLLLKASVLLGLGEEC